MRRLLGVLVFASARVAAYTTLALLTGDPQHQVCYAVLACFTIPESVMVCLLYKHPRPDESHNDDERK